MQWKLKERHNENQNNIDIDIHQNLNDLKQIQCEHSFSGVFFSNISSIEDHFFLFN